MRYLGKEYTGKGVVVAIVDSGINRDDPRLAGAQIEGWSITLGATGHALLSSEFHDENGHGTEMAAAVHHFAPDAKLLGIKIMGERLRPDAELIAAGIEISQANGARVINLSLGTQRMGKALLLSDCVGNAVEQGSIVLAAAHPKGERVYPADLPNTVGVAAHEDCPLNKFYYFSQSRFPKKEWGFLSSKFMTHGFGRRSSGEPGKYYGSGVATAYLSGITAALCEAQPGTTAQAMVELLQRQALVPTPELGYA